MNYDLDNTMMVNLREITKERDELDAKLKRLIKAAEIMVDGFASDNYRAINGYYSLIEALIDQKGLAQINTCGEIKASFQGETECKLT